MLQSSSGRKWKKCETTLLFIAMHYRGYVTFNLDPPKIGSPRNEFFWNIWTHSENFVPTVDQPRQGKSVLVNDHEVTTKDISGVHRGIFRKLSDWFSSVCLGWPYAAFTKIIAQCTRGIECSVRFRWEWGLYNCVLLNLRTWKVSRTSLTLLDKPLVQICKWNMFRVYVFSSVWGGPNFSAGVHILQKNKFRGVLIYQKISSGGNQFWGVHFYHDRYASLEVKGRWGLLLPPCLLITAVQQPGTSSPPSRLKRSSTGVIWMCKASFTNNSCPLPWSNTVVSSQWIGWWCSHACSATAEFSIIPLSQASRCSFSLVSSLRLVSPM